MNLGTMIVYATLFLVGNFISVFLLRAAVTVFNKFVGEAPESELEVAAEHGFRGVIPNYGRIEEPTFIPTFAFLVTVNVILNVVWYMLMPAVLAMLDVERLQGTLLLLVYCGIVSANILLSSIVLARFLDTTVPRALAISIIQIVLSVLFFVIAGTLVMLAMGSFG
ncbi:hypothetical protein AB1L30_03710 [Bremerella sp. JC817]|uniref:hypothetical protein n=1 Tax=Bremerella sp. JC817 TaxID=3231756 RepID=UPI003457A1FD